MKQPNIVWVLTDDQNLGSLNCGGNPQMITPAIDQFFQESVHMTDYHVGPTCAPTRSSLMTGHYANSTGVWHTVGGRSLLRKDEWTIATALKDAGYVTGIFGKWHLGDTHPYCPQDRGFMETVVYCGGAVGQTPDYWGNDYFDDVYRKNGVPTQYHGYCTDVFFAEAENFIEAHKDEPFFCYLPTNAPHEPLNVPKKYSDMYKDLDISEDRKRYFGMISCIDENFKHLMDKLTALDLIENTIFVFMTDNGAGESTMTLDCNQYVIEGYNAGLRGYKNSEYDGGHRVPFFIRYPAAGIGGNKNVTHVTSCVDVMPTLLDLCGVDPKEHTFHGKSLVPVLKDTESDWEPRVIVTDSQRLTNPQKWRKSSVLTDDWRLINGFELYDAKNDREQRCDIAWEHPEVVKELRAEYDKWWDIVSDRFDEMIPQFISAKWETILIPHDMRSTDHVHMTMQREIRRGKGVAGYWEVEVEDAGEYNIELRRWPRESPRTICAGIDATNNDVVYDPIGIAPDCVEDYVGGVALPINKAYLHIQNHRLYNDITPQDEQTIFRVHLEKGQCYLKSWFVDQNNKSYTAFYIYVTPVK